MTWRMSMRLFLRADGAGGVHEGLLAQAEDGGARDAGHARGIHYDYGDDDVLQVGSEYDGEGYGEQDGRDCHEAVHDAHENGVNGPEVARDRAEGGAENHGENGDGRADEQGYAPAEDGAAEHVSAELVGPEPVRGGGRLKTRVHVYLTGVGGR